MDERSSEKSPPLHLLSGTTTIKTAAHILQKRVTVCGCVYGVKLGRNEKIIKSEALA